MKPALIVMLVPLAAIAAYFGAAYFVLPGLFPPFYYASFNQTRDHLTAIPGVRIIDSWKHEDITLEDCGFTLRVNESQPVRIDFHDGNDWARPFEHIDGITVSYPYNPETNGYDQVSFSAKQLRDHGIDSTNLGTVLPDIEKVLQIANSPAVPSVHYPRLGEWVYIFRDLDRYKHKPREQHTPALPGTTRPRSEQDHESP